MNWRRVGTVPGPLVQEVPSPEEAGVSQDRPQRLAVHPQAGSCAGSLDDRGRQVDVRHGLAEANAGANAGAPHDQGHARGRLVDGHLPERNAVLTLEEAIVRREDDQRVVELTAPIELVDDPAHRVVHG